MRLVPMLMLLGCAAAELLPEATLQTTSAATACSDDSDCVITHNPCDSPAFCTHDDDRPATNDVVCDPARFLTPERERCVCGADSSCIVLSGTD